MTTSAANVDPVEIRKFEMLASRWWDPESEFKPLHDINPLRLDYIDEHSPLRDARILDVGCGGGILAESMAARDAQVSGIDLGEAPLRVAQLHAKAAGVTVEYRQVSAEALAAEMPGHFDIVTCMELLEHVPDPASTVSACAALVKPGGAVYFSTINRTPKGWLLAIVGAEYVLGLLPRGTHQYDKFIRPAELEQWCRAPGLRIEHLTGMHYNPVSGRYWLAAGLDVNYLVYARRATA